MGILAKIALYRRRKPASFRFWLTSAAKCVMIVHELVEMRSGRGHRNSRYKSDPGAVQARKKAPALSLLSRCGEPAVAVSGIPPLSGAAGPLARC